MIVVEAHEWVHEIHKAWKELLVPGVIVAERLGKFSQDSLLEGRIVGYYGTLFAQELYQILEQRLSRIVPALCKITMVYWFRSIGVDNMKRELEGDLLKRAGAIEQWNGCPKSLEIKEIKWIIKACKKLPNAIRVNMRVVSLDCVNLN